MTQTAAGILIGIATSFIAGIFLIWKGEQIVRRLRRLPTKWRVALYTRAYLVALKCYPYRYAHQILMMIIAMMIVLQILFYIGFTVLSVKVDFSLPREQVRESIKNSVHAPIDNARYLFNPWVFGGIALFLLYTARAIIFVTIPVELLVPYAHRELTRLRECVAKCATKKQFLEYTDAEHNASTLEDLKELIGMAKSILGTVDLHLADEIFLGVSEEFPELEGKSIAIEEKS